MPTPSEELYPDDNRSKLVNRKRSSEKLSREKRKARAAELMKAWDRENPEKRYAINQKWAKRNPYKVREHRRRADLKRFFGITVEQYDSMLSSQGNLCAICKKNPQQLRRYHVDHCHATGKIRGILCHKCNLMLGYSRDSVEVLQSAIDYLRAHSEALIKD